MTRIASHAQEHDQASLTTELRRWGITSIGVLLAILIIVESLLHVNGVWLIHIVELCLAGTLIYGGYQLTQGNIDSQQRQTIEKWCFLGIILFSSATTIAIFIDEIRTGDLTSGHFRIQTVLISSALLGFVVGTVNTIGSSYSSPSKAKKASRHDVNKDIKEHISQEVLERWLVLLADQHYRHILRVVAKAPDGVMTIDELGNSLVNKEFAEPQQATIRLRHAILHKLSDSGLLDYDERTNTVRYWRQPAFEQLFELVNSYESDSDENQRRN